MKVEQSNSPRAAVKVLELSQAPGRSCSLKSSCPHKDRAEESLVVHSLQEGMGLESIRVQWGYRTPVAKDLGTLVLVRFPITVLGESKKTEPHPLGKGMPGLGT